MHFTLTIEELGESFIEPALQLGDLLLDAAEAPFDIAFYLMAQAFFQFSTDHSLFPPVLGS